MEEKVHFLWKEEQKESAFLRTYHVLRRRGWYIVGKIRCYGKEWRHMKEEANFH